MATHVMPCDGDGRGGARQPATPLPTLPTCACSGQKSIGKSRLALERITSFLQDPEFP